MSRYRRFMGERDAEPHEDLKTYAQAIKGDEAFARRMLEGAGRTVARMGLTERDVASAVGKACGFSGEELRGSGRYRPQSRARILAAYLARSEGGISIARMARFFGREESTMVRGVLRLEQEMAASEDLRREVARLGNAVRSA